MRPGADEDDLTDLDMRPGADEDDLLADLDMRPGADEDDLTDFGIRPRADDALSASNTVAHICLLIALSAFAARLRPLTARHE